MESLQQKEAMHPDLPDFLCGISALTTSPLYLVNSWVSFATMQPALRPHTTGLFAVDELVVQARTVLKLRGKSRSFMKTGDKSN